MQRKAYTTTYDFLMTPSMPHYLTREGLEKMKNDLIYMKTVLRREVIERIATAKELGDLKENAEYAEAKEDQGLLESKILEMDTIVKGAIVIEDQGHSNTIVSVGSSVTISTNNKKMTYMIVGTEEADPAGARISFESPIGKAFLNKRVGDTVLVRAPKGEYQYTIVEIQ